MLKANQNQTKSFVEFSCRKAAAGYGSERTSESRQSVVKYFVPAVVVSSLYVETTMLGCFCETPKAGVPGGHLNLSKLPFTDRAIDVAVS